MFIITRIIWQNYWIQHFFTKIFRNGIGFNKIVPNFHKSGNRIFPKSQPYFHSQFFTQVMVVIRISISLMRDIVHIQPYKDENIWREPKNPEKIRFPIGVK